MMPGEFGPLVRPAEATPWFGRSPLAYGAVTLIGLLGLAALSLLFDSRLEAEAQTLSPDAVAWGRFVSALAKSAPLYAAAGSLTAVPLLLRAVARLRSQVIALTVVAERAGYLLATLAVSSLAAQAVKHTIGRARPHFFTTLGPYYFDGLSIDDGFASFPSGHSTTAFAVATALSLLVPELRVASFVLAAAIAASRVVVQAHYLSDIAAGTALGWGSALLAAHAFARWGLTFTRGPEGLALKTSPPGAERP